MELSAFLPQLLTAMLLIVVLIAALGLLGKRLVNHSQRGVGNLVKVLSCTPIGTREKLMLVSLGKRRVLVGVTPTSINALMELADHELPPVESQPAASDSPWVKFTQSFGRVVKS